ncbi:MAG: GNAT family N-acetyltransferase [Gammaproteobacteria bacterium]|nr:GNAT family N-acetyltransferase [Gammaproteobacteria bacterium]
MIAPHPYPIEIPTARLILRRPTLEDASGLHEAVTASYTELSRWMVWARGSYNIESAEEACIRAKEGFDSGVRLPTLLRLPDDGKIIGMAELESIDPEVPSFEIGYWIHSAYSGHGYVTEATHALTTLAFQKLDSNRVQIRVDTNNQKSWAIPERLGYKFEAALKSSARDNLGDLTTFRVYAMFKIEQLLRLR